MPAFQAARAVVVSFSGSRDVVEVDACLDETHQYTNTITDHEVEDGTKISDHSRPDPDVATLRCFISNTPLSPEQQTRTIREGAVTFETTAAAGVRLHQVDGRGQQAFKKLLNMRSTGQLVKVATPIRTYESNSSEGMAIQSLNISRTRQNYDGLEFTITLKQIKIVKSKQTSDRTRRDTRTGKKKKEGNKVTKEAKNEDSALHRLAETGSESDNAVFSGLGNAVLRR